MAEATPDRGLLPLPAQTDLEDVLAVAALLVAATSPRAIARRDQVGDRIVVSRRILLLLQDKVEAALPGIVDRVRDRLAGSGWDPVPHAWQRRGPS